MRFSLVDRILTLHRGESITAIKNLSRAEEYLADHFPGYPVMPGVLMLETLVQASAWLMRETHDFRFSTILLKEVRGLKFNNFVQPGMTLTVSSTVHKSDGNTCTFKGEGTVDGLSAVRARLTLEQFNLSEKDSSLEESDRLRIEALRQQFAEVWSPGTGSGTAEAVEASGN